MTAAHVAPQRVARCAGGRLRRGRGPNGGGPQAGAGRPRTGVVLLLIRLGRRCCTGARSFSTPWAPPRAWLLMLSESHLSSRQG